MLQITEDIPRQSLLLQWKGLPRNFFWNLLLIGITGPLAFLFLALSLYSFYSVAAGKAEWGALLVNVLVLPFLAIIVAVHYAVDRLHRNLTMLSANAESGSLHWRESGTLMAHDIVVPLSGVRELRFDIGAEGQSEMPVQITMAYSLEKGSGRVTRTVRVKSVNLRLEAMDLVFRFAKILGWGSYEVARNDPRSLIIELVKNPSGGSLALPVGAGRMNFDVDIRAAAFEEPEMEIKPFDPQSIKEYKGRKQVIQWRPGDAVRVQVPGVGIADMLHIIMPVTYITGQVAWSTAALFDMYAWKWLLALLGAAAGFGVSAFLSTYMNRETEFTVDWTRREGSFRKGRSLRKFPLTDIQEIVLQGRKKHISQKNRKGYTMYWCELIAVLPGPDALIFSCASLKDDPDRSLKRMLPMAVELARALNVRWRWNEY